MTESPLYRAMKGLDPDQLYVIVSYFWGGLTERAIAEELSHLRERPIGRDRVHRIRLTAESRLRRGLEQALWEAA